MVAASAETKVTLPSDLEILITRVFDAPREAVFKAMTDPDLIPRWWGPRAYTTIVETMDVRPGGKWRFLNRMPDGTEFAFYGEYSEVTAPERLVQTFEFSGAPGHVSLETAAFVANGDKTELIVRTRFDSKEDRDAVIQSGMEVGLRETHERFAELLAQRRSG